MSIRNDGYVYVDKTVLVYRLANEGKYYFLSRPRRFGKSLLISTMEAYFSGRKELFHGLAIEKMEKEWKQYLVLHLDLNTGQYQTVDSLLEKLNAFLVPLEEKYGRGPGLREAGQRFEYVIKAAAEKSGKQIVLLVDEYDKPMLSAIGNEKLQDDYRIILKSFYGVVKSCDRYFKFAFFTGVTKFGKISVFSDLNSLTDISMDWRYNTICGITENEMTAYFTESIHELAVSNHLSFKATCERLRKRYDGYHFLEEGDGLYNPYSLLSTFSKMRFGSYWFETGTPTFLLERLRMNPMDETKLDKMTEIAQSDFDISPELTEDTLPMLYQTGYLTIKGYNKEDHSYTLGYPNREVREGFLRGLLANYKSSEGMSASFVLKFNKALKDNDVNGSLELLQSFMAGIPYDLENKTEKHYQTIIYLVFSLLGYYTQAEVKSAVGRADAVCRTKDGTYVFEFKVDGSAEEALKQIDEKGYMIPYKKEGRCVKVGVNISSATRTLDSWKVAEEV